MANDILRQRILVTGGTGMVGHTVVAHPAFAEAELLHPPRPELDLRSADAVADYIATHRPAAVVHCAGVVGGISANMREPARFLVDNFDMGRNVVLAARDAGVRTLINLSSSCMYPRNREHPLREEHILDGPLEPTNEGYALAKISVDRLCEYTSAANPELAYKTLIPCNLYGPGDNFDPASSHMIPAVVRKLHDAVEAGATTVEIWGDGTARREAMYVGDLADFIGFALPRAHELPPRINVGTGTDHSIDDFYHLAAKVIGYRGTFEHNLDKPVGMQRKLLDVGRAHALGWRAKTSLEQGLRQTHESFVAHQTRPTGKRAD